MSASTRSEDGFTFVELMISLALLSLMTAYALSAFGMLRDMNRIAAAAAAKQEVYAVTRHMRESLGDIRVQFIAEGDSDHHLLFEGLTSSIRFVTASNGLRETGGLYVVRYVLDDSGDLVSERALLQTRPSNQVNRVVLLRGVSSISFGYMAKSDSNGEASPQAAWEDKRNLPQAIAVSVGFKADDQRRWPETWIRLGAAK